MNSDLDAKPALKTDKGLEKLVTGLSVKSGKTSKTEKWRGDLRDGMFDKN